MNYQPEDLDDAGLYLDEPESISTTTGRVSPLALTPESVSIVDIARGLSRQCRYLGHVGGFLSVARHSIWVSQFLARHYDTTTQLCGLLHDAAEAYLGDMPRPLKHSPFADGFRDAEDRAMRVIAEAFELPWPFPPEVAAADNAVLHERELHDARWDYFGNYERDEEDFLAFFLKLKSRAPLLARGRLIGLCGPKRVGKDTVGAALIEAGIVHERVSCADAIRNVLLATNPIIPVARKAATGFSYTNYVRLAVLVEQQGWEKLKDDVPEVRQLLQRLGTEGGRAYLGENVWTDAAFRDVKRTSRYVVTDVRFPQEADAIRDRGGELWLITRPGYEPSEHISDHALDGYEFDRVIVNNSTRRELRRQVLSIYTD